MADTAASNRARAEVEAEVEWRRRTSESDRPYVIAAYEERRSELDEDAASWPVVCAGVGAVCGLVGGTWYGVGEGRRERERWERAVAHERDRYDRALERHDRACERFEYDQAARYDREHRAALAISERSARERDDGPRADLALLRPAPAPSRWAAPEPPRPPKEADSPDLLGTILWWASVAGTLGTGVGSGAGKVVEHLYGPRRGPWEAEMPAVVEERLRAQLACLGGAPAWRVQEWRAIYRELARGDRAGNRAGNRLIGAAAREIPGGRVVAAFLGEEDDERRKR